MSLARRMLLLGLAVWATAVLAAENKPAATEEADGLTEARPNHYLFAHRALPQIFFANSERLMADLKRDPAGPLAIIWGMVSERLDPKQRLDPEGLAGECRTDESGRTIVVVTLPAPERIPEAAFAALVVDGEKQWYLTYERTFAPDDAAPGAKSRPAPAAASPAKTFAVLCGWNKEGAHLNYGLMSEMTRAAFDRMLARFFKDQEGQRPPATTTPDPTAK
jgi:hypothetical protein